MIIKRFYIVLLSIACILISSCNTGNKNKIGNLEQNLSKNSNEANINSKLTSKNNQTMMMHISTFSNADSATKFGYLLITDARIDTVEGIQGSTINAKALPGSRRGFKFSGKNLHVQSPTDAIMISHIYNTDIFVVANNQGQIRLVDRSIDNAGHSVLNEIPLELPLPPGPVSLVTDGSGNSFLVMTENSVFLVQLGAGGVVNNIQQVHTANIGEVFQNINYDPDEELLVVNVKVTGQSKSDQCSYTSKDGGTTWTFKRVSRGANLEKDSWIDWVKEAISGFTQVNICQISSNICITYNTSTTQEIVAVASNYHSIPTGSKRTPIVLSAGANGDIIKSLDIGKTWFTVAQLDDSLGISSIYGMVYNEDTKLYYIIGADQNGHDLILASTDGDFWENINVSRFGTIAATPNSYCAIENDPSDPLGFGQVSCWGSNSENKLGLGNLESSSPARALIPAKIGIAQGETSPISYLTLAGGDYHMCALRTSLDKVDCWGHSGSGELGDGHNYDPNSSTPVATPVAIPNISGKIRALVAGGSHSCILDTKGQAWCWGSNQYGEIDTTNTVTKYTSPTFAYYNSPFHYLAIAAGRDFTCATTATQVNCWGNNYSYPFKSMQISLSQDSNFTAISAGGGNACVLSNKVHSGNTNAWCWGDNSYGQLGNGESGGFSYTPQPVISKSDPIIFSSISQSGVTTCAIESGTGHTYCWGNNQALQTGIPDKSIVVSPESAIILNGKPGIFSNVSEGMLSTCLISNETNESGSIIHNTYCLGSNSLGQLGIGTTESMESQPVLVNTIIEPAIIESSSLKNF